MELKKSIDVVEANVLDHASQFFLLGEILAALDQFAEIITQHASIQLMPRIGNETAAICQHTNGQANGIQIGTGRKLSGNAELLIVEPPWRTDLHLSPYAVGFPVCGKAGG